MKAPKTSFYQYNELAILMQWDNSVNNVLQWRMAMEFAVNNSMEPTPVINHGGLSLLFCWDDEIPVHQYIAQLEELYKGLKDPKQLTTRLWELPIYYHKDQADFKTLQEHTQLSADQLIELHSASKYQIDFLGFLPGFPYLKGLDPLLHIARKRTPSKAVASGAVAVAHSYCGIYPSASPGGWYVLGECPLGLFDPFSSPPTAFKAGDEIKFVPIGKDAFDQMYGKNDLLELSHKYLNHG